jgi:hypothetical protein
MDFGGMNVDAEACCGGGLHLRYDAVAVRDKWRADV